MLSLLGGKLRRKIDNVDDSCMVGYMVIDFSKLSPMCRDRVCENIRNLLYHLHTDLNDTLKEWREVGVDINGSTYKEMGMWRDACMDVSAQAAAVKRQIESVKLDDKLTPSMNKKLWLVMHSHRGGYNHYLVRSDEKPSNEMVIVKFNIDYEDDKEDENLEVVEIDEAVEM